MLQMVAQAMMPLEYKLLDRLRQYTMVEGTLHDDRFKTIKGFAEIDTNSDGSRQLLRLGPSFTTAESEFLLHK